MNTLNPNIRQKLVSKLREVIDPELGVNIIDLGLVYDISLKNGKTVVEYTATTPGCPMRRYLQQKVEEALSEVEGVNEFEARLIWEPTWSVDMIVPDVDFFAVPPPQMGA